MLQVASGNSTVGMLLLVSPPDFQTVAVRNLTYHAGVANYNANIHSLERENLVVRYVESLEYIDYAIMNACIANAAKGRT